MHVRVFMIRGDPRMPRSKHDQILRMRITYPRTLACLTAKNVAVFAGQYCINIKSENTQSNVLCEIIYPSITRSSHILCKLCILFLYLLNVYLLNQCES